ncbi:MAG: hypothetical protein HC802_20970 [Caldilineaceae bacterium]|nr:hypothetical protein [Caldilineaceae bacterium]
MGVFLCGGVAAVYTGWQLVNNTLATAQGNVATLANPTETPLPVYVILTATSPPDAAAEVPTTGSAGQNEYPVAVTATPMQGNSAPAVVVNGTPAAGSAPPAIIVVGPTPLPPTPTALLVPAPIQQLPGLSAAVPTRRDTPDPALLQIPASTPLTETPTPLPTATQTPTSGPVVVVFGPEETELKAGKCTLVHWNVDNVREVYYENLPVNGHGEKEECVDDKDGLYTLTVILTSGEPRIYTTTVTILEPTPTSTPTIWPISSRRAGRPTTWPRAWPATS